MSTRYWLSAVKPGSRLAHVYTRAVLTLSPSQTCPSTVCRCFLVLLKSQLSIAKAKALHWCLLVTEETAALRCGQRLLLAPWSGPFYCLFSKTITTPKHTQKDKLLKWKTGPPKASGLNSKWWIGNFLLFSHHRDTFGTNRQLFIQWMGFLSVLYSKLWALWA